MNTYTIVITSTAEIALSAETVEDAYKMAEAEDIGELLRKNHTVVSCSYEVE